MQADRSPLLVTGSARRTGASSSVIFFLVAGVDADIVVAAQIDIVVRARLPRPRRRSRSSARSESSTTLLAAGLGASNGIGCFDFSTARLPTPRRIRRRRWDLPCPGHRNGCRTWGRCAWCPIQVSPRWSCSDRKEKGRHADARTGPMAARLATRRGRWQGTSTHAPNGPLPRRLQGRAPAFRTRTCSRRQIHLAPIAHVFGARDRRKPHRRAAGGRGCPCHRRALRAMGAEIARGADGIWTVHGVGVGGLLQPQNALDMGNSGTSTAC